MRNAIILSILVIISSAIEAQTSNKFSFEIGVNRSRNINTSAFIPSGFAPTGTPRIITSEKSSHTTNLSMSIGYQYAKNHSIQLRYSKNTLGSRLTGNYYPYRGWCMTGVPVLALEDEFNAVKNNTLGIIYEYQLLLKGHKFVMGLGIERQWNNYAETRIRRYTMPDSNFAMHTSIGYLYSVFDFLEIHPKVFVTNSFTHLAKGISDSATREYVPIQMGLEIGARLKFG